MHLLRVQVPDFRVLKDVDISFEQAFNPNVFPLGSLNGGGKSTLLQLIFVLLHCSAHSERHQFIANMLERVTIPVGENSKLLAKFELMDVDEKIELEFTLCNDDYLRQLDIDPIFNKEMVSFGVFIENAEDQEIPAMAYPKTKVELTEKRIAFLQNKLDDLYIKKPVEDYSPVPLAIRISRLNIPEKSSFRTSLQFSEEQNIRQELSDLHQELNKLKENNVEHFNKPYKIQQSLKNDILKRLESNHQLYITAWSFEGNSIGLLCNTRNLKENAEQIKKNLNCISTQIFLSAPSTQIYLFLNQKAKELLFKNSQVKKGLTYESELDIVKSILPNFLTYDVFATNIVASLIEKARNQDFKTYVDTDIIGTSYQKIIAELNLLTQGKRVLPQLDYDAAITGIVFKTNDGIDIYPEDLSHGDLKRLSIYVWLKSLPEGENIVLMDEIENALHPDWQYQIVRDLVEWGKDNQYILATHSYGLCEALTPAHVKELEPKLITH